MDENEVRALLEPLADDPVPPSRVDLRQVLHRGRRRRRWRRLYLPGLAPVAAAAAVAMIVAGVPFGLGSGPRSPHSARSFRQVVAPRRFDPAVPYAFFGWLPPGLSASGAKFVAAGGSDEQDTSMETLQAAASADGGIELTVNTAGNCHLISSAGRRVPGSLRCAEGVPPTPVASAPSVNGRPAFWASYRFANPSSISAPGRKAPGGQAGRRAPRALVWQYGNDAWAVLGHWGLGTKSTNLPDSVLLRVARQVRYGGTEHEVFGFRLSGVPAGWQSAGDTQFAIINGVLAGNYSALGPAGDRYRLTIENHPAGWPVNHCDYAHNRLFRRVTIDGAQAVLENQQSAGPSLCFNDLHGIYLALILRVRTGKAAPGSGGYGSVMAVFRHMQLLGPDPARWTTNPFG